VPGEEVKPSSLLTLRPRGGSLHQLIHHLETRIRGFVGCNQVMSRGPAKAEESICPRTRTRKSPANPGRFTVLARQTVRALVSPLCGNQCSDPSWIRCSCRRARRRAPSPVLDLGSVRRGPRVGRLQFQAAGPLRHCLPRADLVTATRGKPSRALDGQSPETPCTAKPARSPETRRPKGPEIPSAPAVSEQRQSPAPLPAGNPAPEASSLPRRQPVVTTRELPQPPTTYR
jgi:hypothetical protein